MTAKELIGQLSKVPPDMLVLLGVETDEGRCGEILKVEEVGEYTVVELVRCPGVFFMSGSWDGLSRGKIKEKEVFLIR